MRWFRRLSRISSREEDRHSTRTWTAGELKRSSDRTELAVSCALSFGWQLKSWRFGLVEHCARVALMARRIAESLGLDSESTADLEHAAQLHEIGMLAIPATLIQTSRPLTTDELDQVRAHAWIGAGIVRSAYTRFKGDLVEYQYSEFVDLRHRLGEGGRLLQAAGILRVADVFDTLTNPRPYQRDIPEDRWFRVLRVGRGTQFHPGAVEVLLDMAEA